MNLGQLIHLLITSHSLAPCIWDTWLSQYSGMDSNNFLSLIVTNQFAVDHHTQLENEERGRFARSRRAIESHDLELQAQIAERTFAI